MSMKCTDLQHDQLPQETTDTGNLNGLKGKVTEEKCSQLQMCGKLLTDQEIPGQQSLGSWEIVWEQRRVESSAILLHPLLVIAWKGYQAKQTCGVGQYCLSRSACSRRVAQGQDGCKPPSQHSASTSPSAVPELWDFSPDSPAAQVWRLSEPAETHLSVVCLHNTLHKRRLWSTAKVKHTVVINTT